MSGAAERILVVDDSADAREVIERHLEAAGYCVLTASDAAEAVRALETASIQLIVTDLKMPGLDGLDLIRHVRANFRDTAIIMITGYASIESAVAAVKEGAEDYLSKPFTDAELLAAVQAALETARRRRAVHEGREAVPGERYGLVGECEAMRDVYQAIARAATSAETVLITGESGTGKELVARGIHYHSSRSEGQFLPVNCAGIPEGLVESELFGHVKGAFTGAVTTRAGFFLTAEGGTVFLDEVAELAPSAQAKLLRVLENQEVQMVGASRPQRADVRVIAATNRDLGDLVRHERFREDLFFRLHILTINLPPLRERDDDVLMLLRHFALKSATEVGKTPPRFSDAALHALSTYRWPGNVRELANVVKRLVLMSDVETIDVSDLPSLVPVTERPASLERRTLAEVEAEHIRSVLAAADGNKTKAAEILGIDRKTLRQRLKRHGMGE